MLLIIESAVDKLKKPSAVNASFRTIQFGPCLHRVEALNVFFNSSPAILYRNSVRLARLETWTKPGDIDRSCFRHYHKEQFRAKTNIPAPGSWRITEGIFRVSYT